MSSENGVPAESVVKAQGGFRTKQRSITIETAWGDSRKCANTCRWIYFDAVKTDYCYLFKKIVSENNRCPQCLKEFEQ